MTDQENNTSSQLYFACALNKNFIIIHAEEGSEDNNNEGGDKDEDKDKEGNEDEDEEDKGDEDKDEEMSSCRAPAATKAEKKPSATPANAPQTRCQRSLNHKWLQLLLLT